jgi:hypothetical protein
MLFSYESLYLTSGKKCCKALASARLSTGQRPSASPLGGGGDPRCRELSHPEIRCRGRAAEALPLSSRGRTIIGPAELARSHCQSSALSSRGRWRQPQPAEQFQKRQGEEKKQ